LNNEDQMVQDFLRKKWISHYLWNFVYS